MYDGECFQIANGHEFAFDLYCKGIENIWIVLNYFIIEISYYVILASFEKR